MVWHSGKKNSFPACLQGSQWVGQLVPAKLALTGMGKTPHDVLQAVLIKLTIFRNYFKVFWSVERRFVCAGERPGVSAPFQEKYLQKASCNCSHFLAWLRTENPVGSGYDPKPGNAGSLVLSPLLLLLLQRSRTTHRPSPTTPHPEPAMK